MAYAEFNALSTVLGGSFTARVFLPGLDKLDLEEREHKRRYPVIWLLHSDGETSLQFLKTPIESLVEKYGFVAIAPDMHHAMATDMKWGPNYEKFLVKEARGIFHNNFPISMDLEDNFIGGVGTGGYGALKCACKHPEVYGKAFSLNGILDMGKLFARTVQGDNTGVPQTVEALNAVFGSQSEFAESENDLFTQAKKKKELKAYLAAEEGFPYYQESVDLKEALGQKAVWKSIEIGADWDSFQMSMREAVKWLFS